MGNRVLAFELNEVPYQVIERFVADHPSSSFARLMREAAAWQPRLPDQGQLHPKISWQTFHRGVPVDTHGFREYNQIDAPGREANPTLWELVRDAGHTVGCGASIGSWPVPERRDNVAFWLTDPFAPTPESIPASIEPFQRFNTAAVQRSSRNVRAGGLDRSVALDLLKSLPRIGITPRTCLAVARQLVAERRDRTRAVRRRNIQALMSFDVALAQWQRTTPRFATIFGNHVAAAMQRYWAAAFPDDYDVNNMPADWQATYRDEIDAAMQVADDMLTRLISAIERVPGTRLLLLGSMGQEGIPHEVTRSQLVIGDVPRFLQALGFGEEDYERRPGMEPEYVLAFADAARMDAFEQACERMDIDGRSPHVKRVNDVQCALLVDRYNVEFDHVTLDGERRELADVGLAVETIDDFAGSTAQHVPEGTAIIYDPAVSLAHMSDRETPHDLCAVTASILAALDVRVPDYMPAPVSDMVAALGGSSSGRTTPTTRAPTAESVQRRRAEPEPA